MLNMTKSPPLGISGLTQATAASCQLILTKNNSYKKDIPITETKLMIYFSTNR
jgi:hypothetical protein